MTGCQQYNNIMERRDMYKFPKPGSFPHDSINHGESHDDLIETIDRILDHHYFQERLSEKLSILTDKTGQNSSKTTNFEEDQYYKREDDLIEQISSVIEQTMQSKLRTILHKQFTNVTQEIEGIKSQLWKFMEQHSHKEQQLRKQFSRLTQDVKRKIQTISAMGSNTGLSSISPSYQVGTRFSRNSQVSALSTISTQGQGGERSFHSEIVAIKKQIEALKEKGEKSESFRIINDQFNEFKVQTKVAMQALKYQHKKIALQISTLTKNQIGGDKISPALKQVVQSTVRRSISAQLKVYGSYSDQIMEIRHELQELDEKIQNHNQKQRQYFATQLTNAWIVINDHKRILDKVTDDMGMSTSRIML